MDDRTAGQRATTSRYEQDMAASRARQADRAAQSTEMRHRQMWVDVASGGLLFLVTFWLWYGIPGSALAWLYLGCTVAVGAGAGRIVAWQRGYWAVGIFGGAVVVDAIVLQLLAGDMGTAMLTVILRGFVIMVLGGAIGLARKMGAYEGV